MRLVLRASDLAPKLKYLEQLQVVRGLIWIYPQTFLRSVSRNVSTQSLPFFSFFKRAKAEVIVVELGKMQSVVRRSILK